MFLPGGMEEVLERFGGQDESGDVIDDFPTGNAPFLFSDCYSQTGYPEWLANTAVYWFPEELVEKYGGWVDHSMASDDSLYLLAESAE